MQIDPSLQTEILGRVQCYIDGCMQSYLTGERTLLHSVCAPEATGYGTGRHETGSNRDEILDALFTDVANPFEEISMYLVRADVGCNGQAAWVNGEVEGRATVNGAYLDFPPIRTTYVLQRKVDPVTSKATWWIVHFHWSFPDQQQEDEHVDTEALKAYTAVLEQKVTERTEELAQALSELQLTQAQLIHQEKMASLGQLTAGIAHEIKNPLNFVNNFAQLSEELVDELDEILVEDPEVRLADLSDLIGDLRLNAKKVVEHGKRADGIVRSMMLHAGGTPGHFQLTDLNQLADEYSDLAYHGMKAQSKEFDAAIDKDFDEAAAAPLNIVPQDIGRVLLNLLSNAFDSVRERMLLREGDYTPAVRVSTRRSVGGITVTVQDNGMGVSNEIRTKIFEPFFTTKPTGQGTGLGLSLSYDIVVLGHGGSLQLETSGTEGAIFTMSLPVRE